MNALVNSFGGLTWGDFSNMNGGPFPPHASHRLGLDADGWFPGYNARDAATAATIIGHLNSAAGSDITAVFVTFEQISTDPFWQAIRTVVLSDGRRARDVILPVGGHTTHFHWRKE
jgi:murein endopeptidase